MKALGNGKRSIRKGMNNIITRMKIVHVIDYFQPKLGYQETFLAREHARLGHDVCVVTSDRYNPIVYPGGIGRAVMGNRLVGVGYFIEEGINVWRLKTLFELPHAIWSLGLERKIAKLSPDIVINHGIPNFFAVRIARLKSRKGGFKLIYDDHMQFQASRSIMRMFYPLFRWSCSSLIQKEANALVAILPETKEFMHRRYGIPQERITMIPLGVDEELFRLDVKARKQVRRDMALKEEDIVFIYTGKLIPEKGLHLLIQAVANLIEKHKNIRLLMVGSGSPSYIEELKRDIATRNLRDVFTWQESVPNEELYRFYSAADAGVWPLGPSIGMREALACNLPIVISEGSGVTELVAYDNGFTYTEGDIPQLTGCLARLLNRESRKEMGLRSRQLVEDRFSWKTIAKEFLSLV